MTWRRRQIALACVGLLGAACTVRTAHDPGVPFRCEADGSCPSGLVCDSTSTCIRPCSVTGCPPPPDRCHRTTCSAATRLCETTRKPDGLYEVATIPVGKVPNSLAVDPTTHRVYVPLTADDAVAVVDGETASLIARVPTPIAPVAVAVNPVTHRIYAAGKIETAQGSQLAISVIEGSPGSPDENTVLAQLLPPGRQSSAIWRIAVDPETNRIYVPSFDPGGRLVVIDGATSTIRSLLAVPANPVTTTFDAVSRRVLVGHGAFFLRRRLTALLVETEEVVDGPETGVATQEVAVDPTSHRIYARSGDPSRGDRFSLIAIDGKTGARLGQLERSAHGTLAVNPQTGRIYIADGDRATVEAIDGAPGSPSDLRLVGSSPAAEGEKRLAVDPATGRIFVSEMFSNLVRVLDDLNTDTDPHNCGACGASCAAGQACRAGHCVAPGRWAPMDAGGAPPAVRSEGAAPHAIWTGSKMIVWGGAGRGGEALGTGGSYDPARNRWSPLPEASTPGVRYAHSVVWTGREMIVWGGIPFGQGGAAYDPTTDSWRPLATTGAPAARAEHSAVWTGSRMIVWGGNLAGAGVITTSTGGLYDPGADAWEPMAGNETAPPPRFRHSALWTGREMIVWGGSDGVCPVASGGRYDPAAGRWQGISGEGAASPRVASRAIWTGRWMFVSGGSGCNFDPVPSFAFLYDPEEDAWTRVDETGAPDTRTTHAVVWTGRHVLLWGGGSGSPEALATGFLFDPVARSWTPMDQSGAPPARGSIPAYVWTGSQLLVWGGALWGEELTTTGGVFTPPW